MRRKVLLGAVLPIMALGFLALTVTVLLAQSPKIESAKAPPASVPVESKNVPFGADVQPSTPLGGAAPRPTNDGNAPAIDANPIRQRFIELSKKKANALSEEELKREVESMENQVRELEAWAKADEAMRLLREVAEKHRSTKAAEAASAAIQVLESRRNAATARTPGPVPDPRFEDDFRRAPQPDQPIFERKVPHDSAPTDRPS
jgi:hypothetical protein